MSSRDDARKRTPNASNSERLELLGPFRQIIVARSAGGKKCDVETAGRRDEIPHPGATEGGRGSVEREPLGDGLGVDLCIQILERGREALEVLLVAHVIDDFGLRILRPQD